jgi:hypothetical protein
MLPLEKLNGVVIDDMKIDLTRFKLTQTPRLSGKPLDQGASYDPKERAALSPVAVVPANQGVTRVANRADVKAVFAEINIPPVRVTGTSAKTRDDLPFSQEIMEGYKADDEPDSELRKAVLRARAALWVVSPQKGPMPAELKAEAAKFEAELKGVDLMLVAKTMSSKVGVPANENQFKTLIENQERQIAKIMRALNDVYDDLKDVKKLRADETKRWQAHYDFAVARMEEQIAYLYEFQSMLGAIRKDLPPRGKDDTGWVLASSETLTGDSAGKKLAASSRKIFDQIATDHAGTPWEILAKREKFTALGLEWKPTR